MSCTPDGRWLVAEIELLTTLWEAGQLSASEIALEMVQQGYRARSRNAVVGKAHRLGLHQPKGQHITPRPRPPVHSRGGRRKVGPMVLKAIEHTSIIMPPPEPPKPPPEPPPKPRRSKDIVRLRPNECHWPITDAPPHLFCAGPVVSGGPYCAVHMQRAHHMPPGVRRVGPERK